MPNSFLSFLKNSLLDMFPFWDSIMCDRRLKLYVFHPQNGPNNQKLECEEWLCFPLSPLGATSCSSPCGQPSRFPSPCRSLCQSASRSCRCRLFSSIFCYQCVSRHFPTTWIFIFVHHLTRIETVSIIIIVRCFVVLRLCGDRLQGNSVSVSPSI